MLQNNYNVSFKSSTIFEQMQNATNTKIVKDACSDIFEKNDKEQPLTTKNIGENKNNLALFSVLAGFVAVASVCAGVILKRRCTQGEKLHEKLNNVLNAADFDLKAIQEQCKNTYLLHKEKLNTIKKPEKLEIQPFVDKNKLAKATTLEEIYSVEDEYFIYSNQLFKQKSNNARMMGYKQIIETQKTEFEKELQTKTSQILHRFDDNLQLSDIPAELKRGKKAEKIIKEFIVNMENKKKTAENFCETIKKLYSEDVFACLGDFQHNINLLTVEKNINVNKFLSKVNGKVGADSPSLNSANLVDISNLYPSNLPASIIESPIFKVITKPQDIKNYAEFVDKMSDEVNLNDIEIFFKRLYVRRASKNSFDRDWYNCACGKTKEFYDNIQKILIKMFDYSGTKTDTDNPNVLEIQEYLNSIRKKMGYGSINGMIVDLSMKNTHTRFGRIMDCPVVSIYQKHNDKFIENHSALKLMISRGINSPFNEGALK